MAGLLESILMGIVGDQFQKRTGLGDRINGILDAIIPPAAAADARSIPQGLPDLPVGNPVLPEDKLIPADVVMSPAQEQMVMNRIATEAPERPRVSGRTYLPDITMQEPTAPAAVDLIEQQIRRNEVDQDWANENKQNVRDFVRTNTVTDYINSDKTDPVTDQEVDQVIKSAPKGSVLGSLWDSTFGDEEWRLRKAMILNSMRLNPDAALTQAFAARVKDLREMKGANKTIDALRKAGVPEETLAALAKDPTLLKAVATKVFTKGFADTAAEQRFFETLTEDMTPEEKQKAVEIKLGLRPRAGSQYALTLPDMFAFEAAKARGAATGKTEADYEQQAKSNEMLRATWNSSLDYLSQKLTGTSTGFFSGFLPAITESQQLADQSVSMMMPLLKDMFRKAGEGVFTDKDQQVLEDMIPTRSMSPNAIAQALKQIDTMVQMKLRDPRKSIEEIKKENEAMAAPAAPTQNLTPTQIEMKRRGLL